MENYDDLSSSNASYPSRFLDIDSFLSLPRRPDDDGNQTSDDPWPCVNVTKLSPFEYQCSVIFSVYFVEIFCVIGFVGNFISILVLRRDGKKPNTTNWLLQTLAAVDSIFLIDAAFIMPGRAIYLRNEWIPADMRHRMWLTMQYLWPLTTIIHTLTVWIVVMVTVDRYLAVCEPMKKKWRSLRLVKLALLLVIGLAIVYNIPRFLEIEEIQLRRQCGEDSYVSYVVTTALWKNPYYHYIYRSTCYIIFRSVGPLVILIALNLRICWTLQSFHLKRRQLTVQLKEEANVAATLVAVVIVFVICQLPATAICIAYPAAIFSPLLGLDWEAMACSAEVSNALLVCNSSTNFLIYCLIWRKFNRILVDMMPCNGDKAILTHQLHLADDDN